MRVVIDTNCLVSALLFSSENLGWLRQAWQSGQIVPLISRSTLDELLRVLQYPKFQLTPQEIEQLLADFLPWAETVDVEEALSSSLPQLSDPDDVKFLVLAVGAGAEALVSGDKDILVTKGKLENIPVLTLAELKDKMLTSA